MQWFGKCDKNPRNTCADFHSVSCVKVGLKSHCETLNSLFSAVPVKWLKAGAENLFDSGSFLEGCILRKAVSSNLVTKLQLKKTTTMVRRECFIKFCPCANKSVY